MSTFRTAAQRRVEAEAKAKAEREARVEEGAEEVVDPHEGKLFWPDTEKGPFHFTPPTTAQLGLLGARMRDRRFGTYSGILNLAENLLVPEEFEELVLWIERGDLDLQDFVTGDPEDEVEGGLIGLLSVEAAGRPTQPSSASSKPPKTAGPRSTGRAPSKASTRSSSPSTDS